jgi:hypothetical protein
VTDGSIPVRILAALALSIEARVAGITAGL